MIVALTILFLLVGLGVGLLVQRARRAAVADRHRCPPDRPWAEREGRLRHALRGRGQWIDTDEVGLPPAAVHHVCGAAGWRVQAAFPVTPWAWMLWVVAPPGPVPPAERPQPARRPWPGWLLSGAVAGALPLAVVVQSLGLADGPLAWPVLAVGVVAGVAAPVVLSWDDPLQRPRRLLWEDLTARFDGDRVRVPVGALPWRYQAELVPLLAESLGYRRAWGGSRATQAYRRARPGELSRPASAPGLPGR